MTKEEQVTSIFMLFDKLKHLERAGWYQAGIERDRVESVADHIYGCQMLAMAMISEYKYDVDIDKVLLLLLVHEIGETVIGDKTPIEMSREEKVALEQDAIENLLTVMPNSDYLRELYTEYEEGKTNEAKFAYMIDHAECNLQAKLYDQEGCFLSKFKSNELAGIWIGNDRMRNSYNADFNELLDFVTSNQMEVKEHSESKTQNVVSYYMLANKLKNDQREGEKLWGIKPKHFGSIAEHIYSTQSLALAIYLVYGYDVDIKKIIGMLANHETGEIKFGDKSTLLKNEADRSREFKDALIVTSVLSRGDIIIDRLREFNAKKTTEAIFCKYSDKLAPDLISKQCDSLVDLEHQENNPVFYNELVQKLLKEYGVFSTMWIVYGQIVYEYPEPFISISNYAKDNELVETYTEEVKGLMKK